MRNARQKGKPYHFRRPKKWDAAQRVPTILENHAPMANQLNSTA